MLTNQAKSLRLPIQNILPAAVEVFYQNSFELHNNEGSGDLYERQSVDFVQAPPELTCGFVMVIVVEVVSPTNEEEILRDTDPDQFLQSALDLDFSLREQFADDGLAL